MNQIRTEEKGKMMRHLTWGPRAALLLAASAVLLLGCGDSEEATTSQPAPSAAEFPKTEGRTLPEMGEGIPQTSLVAAPAGQVFVLGQNRYSFGVFTRGREPVDNAEVALYFAPGKTGKAIGPFPASGVSIQTPPAYRAQTTAGEDATSVYVVPEVNLTKPGEWQVIAIFRGKKGLEGTRMPSVVVGRFPGVPKPGEKAPRTHTPTAEEVGGDLSKIDTRVPPDLMHEDDFADVLGKQPAVLLFATPSFCESRVCGPVVDIAEQVRDELGDEEVAFIHMEIFNENDPGKGVRPQLRAFDLPSEPWVFVVDRTGKISSRIEGAFGAEELKQAVMRATA